MKNILALGSVSLSSLAVGFVVGVIFYQTSFLKIANDAIKNRPPRKENWEKAYNEIKRSENYD